MKINLTKLKCKRCGHQWVPRHSDIRICPKCKNPYWDTPKPKHNK